MWYELERGPVEYVYMSIGYAVHSPIGDNLLLNDYTR